MCLSEWRQQSSESSSWLVDNHDRSDYADFLGLAHVWARNIPAKQYMILLCEQRRHFITAFMAAQLAGQTVLLPSSRAVGGIKEIALDYADCYCLFDKGEQPEGVECLASDQLPVAAEPCYLKSALDMSHLAAVVFTSGSTGKARPNNKTWGALVTGARLAQRRFGFGSQDTIVSTVPSQHMYGLETTVMVPLVTGASIHCGRPFFPDDVRQALAACHGRRILITTPVHLRACTRAALEWPELECIISATAPLDEGLLEQVQQTFVTPVYEIYGCTEAGSLASRQPALTDEWCLYHSFRLKAQEDKALVAAPHLDEPVELGDVVEVTATDRFRLLGRKADLVNVAGKRASLSDLNLKLNAIPGVMDGTYIMSDQVAAGVATRLVAVVVAPGMETADVVSQLAQQIDPVFLPRPIYFVDKLPRNETGKLPRQELLAMLKSLRGDE